MSTPSLRFSKAQRLQKPAEFQTVYKSKQYGNTRLFSFNVMARDTQAMGARLGVTVSKKVSKRAVDRNRIKRQIKEFYRLHQDTLHDAHLVITAKPACSDALDQERWASLEELWNKVLAWQRWQLRQNANH